MSNEVTLSDDNKVTLRWEDLQEYYTSALQDINSNTAMIIALQEKYLKTDSVEADIAKMLDGLLVSCRGLIDKTIKIGNGHATDTTVYEGTTVPVAFKTGKVDEPSTDDGLAYINTLTAYMNISEQVTALMVTGWSDVFSRIKGANMDVSGDLNAIFEETVGDKDDTK